jgi:hypothetical protein
MTKVSVKVSDICLIVIAVFIVLAYFTGWDVNLLN